MFFISSTNVAINVYNINLLYRIIKMATTKPNCEEIAEKLSQKLKQSGWSDILKSFLVSNEFKNIFCTLEQTVQDGNRFTPPLKDVFRAFEECPYDKLRVVIVGQDPYPQIGVADGIAFSCSKTGKPEASLRYIQEAIQRTVYQDTKVEQSPDLARWSNQGVLMLNTALTTEVGKIGRHYDIWYPFIVFLIDILNHKRNDITWIFMGKKAAEFGDFLLFNPNKLFCSHPASAAYAKQQQWDCSDVFNKCNQLQESLGLPPITW